MHLAINGRFLLQEVTGVQRYARSVLNVIEARSDFTNGDKLSVLTPGSGRGLLATRAWEFYSLARQARKIDSNCLLSFCNWSPLIALVPSVVVVHDELWREFPTAYSRSYILSRQVYTSFLRRSKATTIVTVSESSRRNLEDFFQRKVLVASPGVEIMDECRSRSLEIDSATRHPFALLVGGHDPRKNARFAERIAPRLQQLGLSLVVVKREGIGSFRRPVSGPHAENIFYVWSPSDGELWTLYREARILLHPSLGEGFGLPLLEASSVGTPFISTDVGVAREVAASPRQICRLVENDWVDAISWVLASSGLGEASRAMCSRYNWSLCAEQLTSICREVSSS